MYKKVVYFSKEDMFEIYGKIVCMDLGKNLIINVLIYAQDNRIQATMFAQMSRRTITYKIQEY